MTHGSSTNGDDRAAPNPGPSDATPTTAAPPDDAVRRAGGLTVSAVAARLGVAPATLRTWDRRYGMGPTQHDVGAHRRYSALDVDRLVMMSALVAEGASPASAAQDALAATPAEARARADAAREAQAGAAQQDAGGPRADAPGGGTGQHGAGGQARRPALRAIAGGRGPDVAPQDPSEVRSPGGSVPAAEARAQAVVDAAIAYDEERAAELLGLHPQEDPADWWVDVVEPARRRLAARVVLAGPGEAPEVVLTNATLQALRVSQRERAAARAERLGDQADPPVSHPSRLGRVVLIFAALGEPVPPVAHALAAALGEHGVTARVVTGPAGAHRSIELVTMVRPTAVVTVSELARPPFELVQAVHEAHPDVPIFVGLGREQDDTEIPLAREVHRVRSFRGLLHETLAAAEE